MGVVVTVSRELGAGGENIALKVAEALGLRVLGQEILHEAMNAGIPEDIALQSEEGKRSWIERTLDTLAVKQAIPLVPGMLMESDYAYISTGLLSSDEYYRSVLESIIFNLTRSEDVLLLGRAGQMIFKDGPNCFHTRIVAPMAKKIPVIEKRFDLNTEQAKRKIEETDKARADYLKRQYHANIDDARLYDLCLNTDRISPETAAQLIVEAVKATGLK